MDLLGSSFRDPSGYVYLDEGILKRRVDESYREQFDLLTSSGLLQVLFEEGLLIHHEEADPAEAERIGAFKVLRPEPLPFVSYPYEWCFGQLKDAALSTLRIQSLSLDHGMTLKDASAFNIQFLKGQPVLIDTLSFEKLEEGRPWVAYGQFCRHFLAPLALMSSVDVRLGQMSRIFLDGIPLDLASELLPGKSKLRPGLQIHIHSHAKSQLKHGSKGLEAGEAKGRFSMKAFRGLIDNLAGVVRSLEWNPAGTTWVDYYAEASHYSEVAVEDKRKLVRAFVERVDPATCWDLGANTGMFSRVAADTAADTIAFDIDPGAVEAHYLRIKEERNAGILPLVVDLSNPSPSIGWANAERMTLEERGPADLVLALALVHHLAIGNNVPLGMIAAWLARLARHIIIEFVPKTDPKVGFMLSSREDVFRDYSIEGFERAFTESFEILAKEPVADSGRTLYLMEKRLQA
ncbi:MAG: SAM-dependent methyltransferase [Actinomycetota bacterium]